MLSNPYPTQGTARSSGKIHAEANGVKEFILMVDLENKQYHFSAEEVEPESKMIVFGRYKFNKGIWLEKPIKAAKKGA